MNEMNKKFFWMLPVAAALLLLGAMLVSVRAIAQEASINTENELGIYTVCTSGPPDCGFNVIQDAVDAANNGDLIKVAAGAASRMTKSLGTAAIQQRSVHCGSAAACCPHRQPTSFKASVG